MQSLSRDFDILLNGQQIQQEYTRTKLTLLHKVLLNLHIFPVLNKNSTEPYLGPLHRSYTGKKSSFKFLSVKSLKEFSSLKQYEYEEGFQRFHTGVKL